MQEDFHYYATYCAAILAGFSHEESLAICYSDQFVDICSVTYLSKIKAPKKAATTQLSLEMMDARTDIFGLQDITRIWASFHFLPKDLYANKKWCSKRYLNKYRLICGPNGELLKKTVENAKDKSLQHIGIAMHVLSDTWAHSGFAGTPSLVINNTNRDFYELIEENGVEVERKIKFRHSTSSPDDLEKGLFTNTLYQGNENHIMNLGHGRAGHFPDYSFAKYKYVPAWGDYHMIVKDNPSDYMKAFTQLIYALKYLRGDIDSFETDTYDLEAIKGYEDRIDLIFRKRQLSATEDFKKLGEELSGKELPYFDMNKYADEYKNAAKDRKDDTFLGRFIKGAISHKGLVSDEIEKSGNALAGFTKIKGIGL